MSPTRSLPLSRPSFIIWIAFAATAALTGCSGGSEGVEDEAVGAPTRSMTATGAETANDDASECLSDADCGQDERCVMPRDDGHRACVQAVRATSATSPNGATSRALIVREVSANPI